MRFRKWLLDLAPFIALAALALVLYAPLVFRGKVLYWGDILLAFYPWKQFAADSLREGRIPLWNPYSFLGGPFVANAQSAVFYPLDWLFLGMTPERALALSTVLHLFLAGAFTAAYLRVLKLSRAAAFLGGMVFMLGGFLVTKAQFPSVIHTCVWLPAILALFEQGIRAGQRRWIVGAGVAQGMQLLAGHPQMALISGAGALAYAVARAAHARAIGETRLSPFILILTPMGLGLALAAAQLLPMLELSRYYVRSGGLLPENAYRLSLNPGQALGLLAPGLFGHPAANNYWGAGNYWEMAGYVGVMPLVLALAGFLSRRRLALFYGVLALAALALSFGKYTALYGAIYRYLPAFEYFRAPARFLLLVDFAAAVLAAVGYDALRAGIPRPHSAQRAAVIFAVILFHALYAAVFIGGLAASGRIGLSAAEMPTAVCAWLATRAYLGFVLLLALSLLLVYLLLYRRGAAKPVAAAALLLAMADLLAFAIPATPCATPRLYALLPPALYSLAKRVQAPQRVFVTDYAATRAWNRFASPRGYGLNTLKQILRFKNGLAPNTLMAYRIREVRGYDPAAVRVSWDFGRALDTDLCSLDPKRRHAALHWLSLLGTAYLADGPSADGRFGAPSHASGDTCLYPVPHPGPRVWVTGGAIAARNGEQTLAAVLHPGFEPARTTVLYGTTAVRGAGMPGSARIVAEAPHRVQVRARAPQGGWLVLADTCYPGWQAWVDGKRTAVRRADYALRAVAIPPGNHTVLFRYQPLSFRLGLYLTALAGLCLGILGGIVLAGKLKPVRI